MISIFDMFKIGIGPSSLHTVGPMRAGILFRKQLIKQGLLDKIARFSAHVYGSLSLHWQKPRHRPHHHRQPGGLRAGYSRYHRLPRIHRASIARQNPTLAATTPRLTTNATSCSILPSATRKRHAPGSLCRR